jgi:surfeit locus 1 family protein
MTAIRFPINLRFGRMRLRAGWWPTLGTLLMVPAFIALGVWQLERAEYKVRLQAEYDARSLQPPVHLHAVLEDARTLHFRRVLVRGRYETEHQILLDNRVNEGLVGYHVLTPLRIDGGSVRVLVNRGWVPVGTDRNILPKIDTPEGDVDVAGIVVQPQNPGLRLGPAHPAAADWAPVWQYLTINDVAREVSYPMQPFVVLLDPENSAGGFARSWSRPDTGVMTHQGYAFTWFSFAVALLAIYVLVNTRHHDEHDSR